MKGPGDKEHVARVLTDLAMPLGSYFVGGSGPLVLRGVRNAGDLDIGVTTAYWFQLERDPDWRLVTPDPQDPISACDPPYLEQMVLGLPVNVFFSWCHRPQHKVENHDFNRIFREDVEKVGPWPCLSLAALLRQKVDSYREKDLRDIYAIAAILSSDITIEKIEAGRAEG